MKATFRPLRWTEPSTPADARRSESYISRQRRARWWADWVIEQINAAWCDGYDKGLNDRMERIRETAT
jgi:hypothetical protein